MTTLHLICAARPNFMKIAPLYHVLKKESWCNAEIVHTGQHYDYQMSQAFFDDFELPPAHHYLGVGSGTHAQQTSQTMMAYEKLCLEQSKPDLVIVVGDVNATLACSIAAKKIHLPVAHLEAGLRSFDRTMPEEINRIVTDSISDYFWTPSEDADDNLKKEGIHSDHIHLVGNIMIDTYCMMKDKIAQSEAYISFKLEKQNYIVLTLHRPVNVDVKETLGSIIYKIGQIDLPVIFPVHPRTRKNLEQIHPLPQNLILCEPLGYVDFMNLVLNSAYVISDSGGIQEETTYLDIPCFTLRETTERPITVTMGSNQLVSVENLLEKIEHPKKSAIPPLWDGKTSERIVESIKEILK
ncbi:MAG: UDP-N-acetylglucosamine 2-epimerase (non-hydrolyzing) [Proteobacteria bacterium]|nr:UDP-N-acetylglucosamine 2-epimerase (non-hydrolyzing) [Pseudomonadota bacterium]